jgi:hypothetical protein
LTASGTAASLGRGLTSLVRALKLLGLVAAVAAVFAALTGAAPARTNANSVTFPDSTGENPLAPDITNVKVANDNSGLISFELTIPNQSQLSGITLTIIEIDSDNNPATGSPDPFDQGADYAIQLLDGQSDLFQWDGSNFSRSSAGPSEATLVFANTPTGPVIKINAAELGATKKLRFLTYVISGIVVDPSGNLDDSNAHGDIAPDIGHGMFSFDVKVAPLKLLVKAFKTVPSRPRAGGTFTMRMTAMRNDTGATLEGGAVKCAARAGGAGIAARTHKFAGTSAVCTWLIPASARGKTFRGSITVVFEGKKVTKTFSARIG